MVLDQLTIEVQANTTSATRKLSSLQKKLDSLASALDKISGKTAGMGSVASGAVPDAKMFSNAEASEQLRSSVSGLVTDFLGLNKQVEATNSSMAKVPSAQVSSGMKKVSDSTKKASSGFSTLLSAMKRIAIYRLLRTIIKEITQAFQEGLQNALAYSRTINGPLAQALDSIASHAGVMKNQLGASLGELLTTLQPILNALISMVTRIAQVMSQLFAIFGGRSVWQKATASADKWGKAAGGAGKAAKEWRNQLLGFDVINRLEDDRGSGGGGGAGAAGMGEWEMAQLEGWALEFKNWWDGIKKTISEWWDTLDFTKLETAWGRLKKSFGELAGTLGKGFEWILNNVLLPLAGWTITEVAPELVTALANAFRLLKDVLEILGPILEPLWNNVLKPMFELEGGAFVQFLHDMNTLMEQLSMWLESDNKSFSDLWTILDQGVTPMFESAAALAMFGPIGLVIADTFQRMSEDAWKAGTDIKDSVVDWTTTAWNDITGFVDSIPQRLEELWTNISGWFDEVKRGASELWAKVVQVKNDIVLAVEGGFNKIKDFFARFKIPHINLPHLSVTWESAGSLLQWFGINSVPRFRIDWYANGGFPTAGQLFIANEQGAEMVGSMDGKTAVANNQEIVEGIKQGVMEALASSHGRQDIRVYLDSREIKAGQKRLSMATGV